MFLRRFEEEQDLLFTPSSRPGAQGGDQVRLHGTHL